MFLVLDRIEMDWGLLATRVTVDSRSNTGASLSDKSRLTALVLIGQWIIVLPTPSSVKNTPPKSDLLGV